MKTLAVLTGLGALALASPSFAAFTKVTDYVPSGGPVSAVSAGSTLQGGWIDVLGSRWTVNSSNQLVDSAASGSISTNLLARPTSENNADYNGQIAVTFIPNGGGFVEPVLRVSGASTTSGYVAQISNSNVLQFFSVVNGTATGLSGTSSLTLVSGSSYTLIFNVVQATSTQTLLNATVVNALGKTMGSLSITDTTASLQQVPNRAGLYEYATTAGSQVKITELTTYSDAATSVAVNSAAFHFSPANWIGDTGRGGSVYRQSWYPGSYFDFTFTAGPFPSVTFNFAQGANTPTVTYLVNSGSLAASQLAAGVRTDNVAIPVGGAVTVYSGLTPNVSNTVRVYLRTATGSQISSGGRWGASSTGAVLNLTSAQIDTGSTAGTAVVPSQWVLMGGDSIDECWACDAAVNNFLKGAPFAIGQSLMALGYDVGFVAASASAYDQATTSTYGSIPALYSYVSGAYSATNSRWNKIDSGVSLLDSNSHISAYGSTGQEPALIWWNFGENDCQYGVNTTDLAGSVAGLWAAYHAAAPSAKLMSVIGFPVTGGNCLTGEPTAAAATTTATYKAVINGALPAYVVNADLPLGFAAALYAPNSLLRVDYLHPNALGHSTVAPVLLSGIDAALSSTASAPRFKPGFH